MGLALAPSVLLPGVAGMVVAVAVELDGKAVLRPAAVDAAAACGAVGLGEGEPEFGRRASTASTIAGVVPWRTPASWQARASESVGR